MICKCVFVILVVHFRADETIERILSQVGPLVKWILDGFVLFRSIFFYCRSFSHRHRRLCQGWIENYLFDIIRLYLNGKVNKEKRVVSEIWIFHKLYFSIVVVYLL